MGVCLRCPGSHGGGGRVGAPPAATLPWIQRGRGEESRSRGSECGWQRVQLAAHLRQRARPQPERRLARGDRSRLELGRPSLGLLPRLHHRPLHRLLAALLGAVGAPLGLVLVLEHVALAELSHLCGRDRGRQRGGRGRVLLGVVAEALRVLLLDAIMLLVHLPARAARGPRGVWPTPGPHGVTWGRFFLLLARAHLLGVAAWAWGHMDMGSHGVT
eukprot:5699435-Prymnesium_polylepis.1